MKKFQTLLMYALWLAVTPSSEATPRTFEARLEHQWSYAQKSQAELEKLAEQKDPFALNALGERFHFGTHGVKKDFAKARTYYMRAVDLGSPGAANHMGRFYANGEGVAIDPQEAQKWYARSGELDPCLENRCANGLVDNPVLCTLLEVAGRDDSAAISVSRCFADGTHGFPQDFERAFYYLQHAEHKIFGSTSRFTKDEQQGYRSFLHKLRLDIERLKKEKSA